MSLHTAHLTSFCGRFGAAAIWHSAREPAGKRVGESVVLGLLCTTTLHSSTTRKEKEENILQIFGMNSAANIDARRESVYLKVLECPMSRTSSSSSIPQSESRLVLVLEGGCVPGTTGDIPRAF